MSDKELQKEKIGSIFEDLKKEIEEYGFSIEPTEDEAEGMFQSIEQSSCPYRLCDGSTYTIVVKDGRKFAKRCQCFYDHVMNAMMSNANIDERYWSAEFTENESISTWLKPKLKPDEKPVKKRGSKVVEEEETPDQYIDRNFERIPVKKGMSFFKDFAGKAIKFLNEKPRTKGYNLMLIGEHGRGKTHIGCAIGKEFLLNGKSVYFTTLQNLISDLFNPDLNVRQIMENTDLLIIDEIGWEYHTDSGWALRNIKDLFRIRYNRKLPTVCTSNLYPHEFEKMYEKSIMSVFLGQEYLWILMDREEDIRREEAIDPSEDFDFNE